MAGKKAKPVQHVTPRGTFKFPYLNTPDSGSPENGFTYDPPIYRVTLVLADKDAAPLKKKIDAEMKSNAATRKKEWAELPALKKKKNPFKVGDPPYRPELDDEGNETGATEFTFKMKSRRKDRKTDELIRQRPGIIDAKGKATSPKAVKIGGGTEGKVSFVMYGYPPTPKVGAGVSLRLNAVQILELREWGERDGKSYGFEEEEGYEAGDSEESTDEAEDTESTNKGEEEDDDAIPF